MTARDRLFGIAARQGTRPMYCGFQIRLAICSQLLVVLCLIASPTFGEELPEKLKSSLGPQSWRRDTNGPVLSLGLPGQFDDTHIFAPAVIRENDRYLMWYCGSRRVEKERVFRLGLATSENSRDFTQCKETAVWKPSNGGASAETDASVSAAKAGPREFRYWRDRQRRRLRKMLGIPDNRVPLDAQRRGQVEWDGVVFKD